MKLSEALKKLGHEPFNLNYNFNSQYWELVIFTQDYDIKAEYKGKFLADVLKEHFKEKIDLKASLEAYYQDGYRNLSLNYDNTDYSDNFITLSLNDRYEDQHERTFILKDINDLVNKLENLNSLFTDYEVELTEIFKEARVYGLYR
jgi:hypothetical protein|nr:MAG TPA: hypothetical protein [Caudoviricetes sp.]